MKLIHTSDIHLNSKMTSKLSAAAARERRQELTLSFKRMTENAVREGVSGIIIAGDLFDSERASRKTLKGILEIIETADTVSFLYLSGNHERDLVEGSGLLLPKNLHIFKEDWTYFKLDGVTVVGRSATCPDMFDSLTLDSADKNIVVLHGELTERSDFDGKIGTRDIVGLPIDYLALGHYHSYYERRLSDRCTAVYCGTPEGRGFDETGDKGYVMLDIDSLGIEHRFVKHAMRRLHTVNVDISGAESESEIERRTAAALVGISERELVRVVLVGRHEVGIYRDTDALYSYFKSRFFFLEVEDESKLRISAEDYKNDISLKGEFIRLVLADGELSDEEKAQIIECGIRALIFKEEA